MFTIHERTAFVIRLRFFLQPATQNRLKALHQSTVLARSNKHQTRLPLKQFYSPFFCFNTSNPKQINFHTKRRPTLQPLKNLEELLQLEELKNAPLTPSPNRRRKFFIELPLPQTAKLRPGLKSFPSSVVATDKAPAHASIADLRYSNEYFMPHINVVKAQRETHKSHRALPRSTNEQGEREDATKLSALVSAVGPSWAACKKAGLFTEALMTRVSG